MDEVQLGFMKQIWNEINMIRTAVEGTKSQRSFGKFSSFFRYFNINQTNSHVVKC